MRQGGAAGRQRVRSQALQPYSTPPRRSTAAGPAHWIGSSLRLLCPRDARLQSSLCCPGLDRHLGSGRALSCFAVRRTLFVFVLALFLAYMLAPLVRWVLSAARGRMSRSAAIAIVFLAISILLGAVLATAGPHVTEQAGRFADQLPTLLQDKNIADRLPLPAWLSPYAARLVQMLRDQVADGGGAAAAPVAKGLGRVVLASGASLVMVALLPILASLMLANGPSLREQFLAWTRRHPHGQMWRHIAGDLDVLLGGTSGRW